MAVHIIDLDFNIDNPEHPNIISTVTRDVGANTFILSDDGDCYAGYEPYTTTNVYPLTESSDLCESGYHRANGTCTQYNTGSCPENMVDTTPWINHGFLLTHLKKILSFAINNMDGE